MTPICRRPSTCSRSMHEILAGADAAKEGVDDWNELWVHAFVKTQNHAHGIWMQNSRRSVRQDEDRHPQPVHRDALKDICHKRRRFRLDGDLD